MPPSDMFRELTSQPACWRRIAGAGKEVGAFFAGTGGRMALIGCGTSFHVACAMGSLREEAGLGASDPFAASQVPTGRRYPWVCAVSRTGTTTEVLRALDSFGTDAKTMVITADGSSPLAERADRVLALDFADEESVVQTRFATSAIMATRQALGHPVDRLAVEAEEALAGNLPAPVETFGRLMFVGMGWAAAVAGEAALKLTETAGASCQWYPAMEVRHGPLSALDTSSLVWAMGPIDRDLTLELEATGATVVGGTRDPLVELVVVQKAAENLARNVGRDPDAPPGLGRSVILAR